MEINEIKCSQDVYKFMTNNIEYGWIDINGNIHLNTMKEFRKIYRAMSIDAKTLLLRDKERPEDCQMNERCITLLNSFKNNNYNKQNILDTSNITVNETVDIIENDNRFIL